MTRDLRLVTDETAGQRGRRIYVAGHRGTVGSALLLELRQRGYTDIITRTREELDLTRADDVRAFFHDERPQQVYLAAARVGGIAANVAYPVEFLQENLAIQQNVMAAAHETDVQKLMFLGSSCIYPRLAQQPMTEDQLLAGPVEPTNEAYALAKIAGLKLASAYRRQYGCDFVSVMPTNIYGPRDNFDPATSHVVPSMIRRFHEAQRDGRGSVEIWGSGTPRRELLYVEDLADALVYLMETWSSNDFVNIGTGLDITIRELAETVAAVTGYTGDIRFDTSKPDGMPRKLLNVERLNAAGWHARTELDEGLAATYQWFLAKSGMATRVAAA